MSKFGTKNAWIWVFWGWKLKTILSYLKSKTSNLSNCKISRKNTSAYIWYQNYLIWLFFTKNAIFGYFWARTLTELLPIWNQHPQICLLGKIHQETNMPKFGTQKMTYLGIFTRNALFGYFWATILKELLSYLRSATLGFV